jgi:hypothetical protein
MKQFLIRLLSRWLLALGVKDEDPIIHNNEDPDIVEPEKEPNVVVISEEDLWNNKWPRSNITYRGRILKKDTNKILQWAILQCETDVKAFILDNDEIMKRIIARYSLKKETHDDTILAIQKWVCRGKILEGTSSEKPVLTYTGDLDENDTYEFWQFPFETVSSNRGDCEDGAILIASLAINAGVPAYRVKVAAGDVTNRHLVTSESQVSEGGHAYCIYLASDGEWRNIDWCYYEDSDTPVLQKPLSKNGGYKECYKDTWFTFNNQFAWNQTSLSIDGKLDHVKKLEEIVVKE